VGDHAIDGEDLHGPVGGNAISIVPVIGGAGAVGKAVGKILAGVALVALAIFVPGLGLGLAGSIVTSVGLLGGALILGGVSQLLTPTSTIAQSSTNSGTMETELDPQKSYSFSGIQNTSRQGVPVPIVYGETIIGSVVISAGIDTVQIDA
jgi:predicted phage tail protein